MYVMYVCKKSRLRVPKIWGIRVRSPNLRAGGMFDHRICFFRGWVTVQFGHSRSNGVAVGRVSENLGALGQKLHAEIRWKIIQWKA